MTNIAISKLDHPNDAVLVPTDNKYICIYTTPHRTAELLLKTMMSNNEPSAHFIIDDSGIYEVISSIPVRSTNDEIFNNKIVTVVICMPEQCVLMDEQWVTQSRSSSTEYVTSRLNKELYRLGYQKRIPKNANEYTSATEKAIMHYQKDRFLKPTGICDLRTFQAISFSNDSFLSFDESDDDYFFKAWDMSVSLAASLVGRIGGDHNNIISPYESHPDAIHVHSDSEKWFQYFSVSIRTFVVDVNSYLRNRYINRSTGSMTYEDALNSLLQMNIIDRPDKWHCPEYIINNADTLIENMAKYFPAPANTIPIGVLYANSILESPELWMKKLYTDIEVRRLIMNFISIGAT